MVVEIQVTKFLTKLLGESRAVESESGRKDFEPEESESES